MSETPTEEPTPETPTENPNVPPVEEIVDNPEEEQGQTPEAPAEPEE